MKILILEAMISCPEETLAYPGYARMIKVFHMEGDPLSLFYFVILMVLSWVVVLAIQGFLVRRAISKMLDLFRKNHSFSASNSKTAQDLGLGPRSLFSRTFGLRDYRPIALQVLLNADVIRVTEEGKLYLSEEKAFDFMYRNRIG